MAAPNGRTSMTAYYNDCPYAIIRDFKDRIYDFPRYTGPESGGRSKETSGNTWYNGRLFGGFVWNDVFEISIDDYTQKTTNKVRDSEKDNCIDDDYIPHMTDNHGNIPGYTKMSGGRYKNDAEPNRNGSTYNYIVADRGDGFKKWAFSLYIKKDIDAFAADLADNMDPIIAFDCRLGNWRYEKGFCKPVCGDNPINTNSNNNVKDRCNEGAAEFCRDKNFRWGNSINYDSKDGLKESGKCLPLVKNGTLNSEILSNCKKTDMINKEFCKDMRLNNSSNSNTDLQKGLNEYLYGEVCTSNNYINTDTCSEARSKCNANDQLLANIAPFNCRNLVKGLNNDDNIKKMIGNVRFKDLAADKKKDLLEYFSTAETNAVEDYLCNITDNTGDTVCQDYYKTNFTGLITADSASPIQIMYFEGGDFNTKKGMSVWNSSDITFRAENDSSKPVGPGSNKITLGSPWSAKIYTYLTPSTTGDYLFKTPDTDDLVKVYLNNNLIINNWDGVRSIESTYINLDSTKGPYLLYAEYRDTGGVARCRIHYTSRKEIDRAGSIGAAQFYQFGIMPENIALFGTSPIAGLGPDSLFMSRFNPYKLVAKARELQSVKYCNTADKRFATNDNCRGTKSNGYDGFNAKYVSTDDNFRKAMIDHCGTGNNFSTDIFCTGDPSLDNKYINGVNKNDKYWDSNNKIINTAIDTFCKAEKNNTPSSTNKEWCKITDNLNNSNTNNKNLQPLRSEYANTLRKTRLKYNQDAISVSAKTNGSLTQDVVDYIDKDYLTLQTGLGTNDYPDSIIATPEVLSFCENSDPKLQSKLCSTIYNNSKYKTGTNVVASRARIDDTANCIDNKAFMGKSTDANFNRSCMLKRDAPATYARYLPLAVNYCAEGDNIVSDECKTYYDGIQGNINNAMNAVYTNGGRISFTNKESFRGGNCNDSDENDNYGDGDDCKKCDDTCDDTCDNSYDYTFLFILFICFVLVLCCISSYSSCKKNKYAQLHDKFQSPFPLQVKLQSL